MTEKEYTYTARIEEKRKQASINLCEGGYLLVLDGGDRMIIKTSLKAALDCLDEYFDDD